MRIALLIIVASTGSWVGCGTQDEITRYSIAVAPGPSDVQSIAAAPGQNTFANAVPSRMLAAIIPQGKWTWFFKLTGPDNEVAEQQDLFAALLKSVRFVGQPPQPTWDLPDGWRQLGPSGMRFATIEFDAGQRKMELTVIPLETRGDLDQYVLGNINRWRGQLGLAPVTAITPADHDDASASVQQFKLSDSTLVTLVNLVGQSGGSDAMAAVGGFDMANHPPIGETQVHIPSGSSDDRNEFQYTAPDGWSATKVSGMRRAAFEVIEGDKKVEITVISLPQSGGERLANVNRWRNQIKLSDTTAEQLDKELQKIPLATATGDYVQLVGPADATPRESILAVLTDVSGSTWFFKLKGDADLAEQQRERFQTFVRSVKFSGTKDGAADD